MGPRLFRRGNPMRFGKNFAALGSFNGATSFQTWKSPFPDWGGENPRGSFNGATSFQTWKYPSLSPVRPFRFLLQWGHVFSDVEMTKRLKAVFHEEVWLQWGHVFSDVEM